MRQNEFLFKETVICAHFGAKRKVFWCKTQGILVLNAS